MPQQAIDKDFIDFRPGLVTEAGYLNNPPGATIEEQNFRLKIDGSRVRRRGLDLEAGGSAFTLTNTMAVDDAFSVGHFTNAGGDPTKDFIVVQIGNRLHFYLDNGVTLSTQKRTEVITLGAYATGTEDVAKYPVDMASGHGTLIVVGQYIEPIYIEYDPVGDTFTANRIEIYERDFHTIPEDGVVFTTQPSTLSDTHKYNLRNRGWSQTDIDAYFTGEATYPALGMLWYKGYARQVDGTTYINEDGVKAFNSTKMAAEPFGNASAPLGSLYINPFNTETAVYDFTGEVAIDTFSFVDNGTTWTLTINTATPHGLVHPADITIAGQQSRYTEEDPEPGPPLYIPNQIWTYNGNYTTDSVPDADTFTIIVPDVIGWDSWDDQYEKKGVVVDAADTLTAPDFYVTDERPTATAWFAGRAWYAGTRYEELADRIWFSKLIRYNEEADYGVCYQRNDPTDEIFNALLPDDGGTIIISDIGRVLRLMPYNGSLIAFSDEGVWEISGSRGVFTADNYNVRKVSEYECSSAESVIVAESMLFYAGAKGIFVIRPDENTGILYARSITEVSVQTEINNIPNVKKDRIFAAYDDAQKEVHFLYSTDSTDAYYADKDVALVFNIRLNAWSKLTYPTTAASYAMGAVAIKSNDESDQYGKLKYLVQTGTRTTLEVCDHNQSDFLDYDDTEQDTYFITAYDNLGSWAHFKQAPRVVTYMKKTETGFSPAGAVQPDFTDADDAKYTEYADQPTTTFGFAINASDQGEFTYFSGTPFAGLNWQAAVYNQTLEENANEIGCYLDFTGLGNDTEGFAGVCLQHNETNGFGMVMTFAMLQRKTDTTVDLVYGLTGTYSTVLNISVADITNVKLGLALDTPGSDSDISVYVDDTLVTTTPDTYAQAVEYPGACGLACSISSTADAPKVTNWWYSATAGAAAGSGSGPGGSEMTVIGESALKMQARWDWSDHINSGEFGSEIECYKRPRMYLPASAADTFDDGYPLVVARHKIRGKGRSLHLKFTAQPGKDAWLYGYSLQYQVSRRS